MAYFPLFGSKSRQALWQREQLAAHLAGRGPLPICNLCGLAVKPSDCWEESHSGAPKAFGGKSTGIAHHRCNHEHGAEVVVPAAAKAKRVYRKHIGAAGVGLGRYTQAKNEHRNPVELDIPLHPDLLAIIAATPSGQLAYLVTAFGQPFTAAGFGNWFRDRCDEAGLPNCSAHGLRKASAARLAERGATAHEIMAITGHRSLAEVE